MICRWMFPHLIQIKLSLSYEIMDQSGIDKSERTNL